MATVANITRRHALKLFPAGIAAAAVADEAAALPVIKPVPGSSENPEIFEAYEALLAARDELAAAKSELEWLGDEWRHVWPLAPEGLFRFAHAQGPKYGIHAEHAELDLIGRPVMREVSSLSARWQALRKHHNTTSTCFSIDTVERLENWLENLVTRPPHGKTEKAIARHNGQREDAERKLDLAMRYEAAKADVRKRSGVEQVQQRVDAAENAFRSLAAAVSGIPVTTLDGLRIKAEALRIRHPKLIDNALDCDLGGFMVFARDFLSVSARTA